MLTLTKTSRDLVGSIERRILARTHGRVRNLRVILSDSAVVLQGYVPTYYTKQLALDGALSAISDQEIDNRIEVC